ncbi:hypothetical protein [Streptomyces sp. NPDC059928]|uniref:hypothetical protein n=1 Tax=unclassified Streptomyces TaxID=2593676 RepID=UPI00364BBDAB
MSAKDDGESHGAIAKVPARTPVPVVHLHLAACGRGRPAGLRTLSLSNVFFSPTRA